MVGHKQVKIKYQSTVEPTEEFKSLDESVIADGRYLGNRWSFVHVRLDRKRLNDLLSTSSKYISLLQQRFYHLSVRNTDFLLLKKKILKALSDFHSTASILEEHKLKYSKRAFRSFVVH